MLFRSPAGTVYGQYYYDSEFNQGPVYFWERIATGPTVITGTNTAPSFTSGPYSVSVYVSSPNSSSLSSAYTLTLADNTDATDFVTAWSAANIPYTTATVTTDGAIQLTHTEGGEIVIDDVDTTTGLSTGLNAEAGFVAGTTDGCKYGPSSSVTFTASQTSTTGSGTGATFTVNTQYGQYFVTATPASSGNSYAAGDSITIAGASLGGATPTNNLVLKVV